MIPAADDSFQNAFDLSASLAARYDLSALSGLLEATRAALAQDEVAVAVLGRFKAGKSSFLNHLIGRAVLPTGVVPVTTAITELRGGSRERALVEHTDGAAWDIDLDELAAFASEKENPGNGRGVRRVIVESPALQRFPGLRFVDTPGLESVLDHNTRTSLDWLPRAGIALVAVSVDPPLSCRDLELLETVTRYTPSTAVLLTKADLIGARELAEVLEYIRGQLARRLGTSPPVFPYSTRPGFEHFRRSLEAELLQPATVGQREPILAHKLDTLLGDCAGYLRLSLAAAETLASERQRLAEQAGRERKIAAEVRLHLRLLVRDAAAGARQNAEGTLDAYRGEMEGRLLRSFECCFAARGGNLGSMLESFEAWLADALRGELAGLFARERGKLLSPLEGARGRAFRLLQEFRDRLSGRALEALGVPLHTTETEIAAAEPAAPDIRIGRVFDRNWELLSPVLPAVLIRPAVYRHFRATIPRMVERNLSRAATQWEEALDAALGALEKEAARRLDELLATLERLLATATDRVPEIRTDLERVRESRRTLEQATAA
jgi:GTP-binding protein EngB required for normal cell division